MYLLLHKADTAGLGCPQIKLDMQEALNVLVNVQYGERLYRA